MLRSQNASLKKKVGLIVTATSVVIAGVSAGWAAQASEPALFLPFESGRSFPVTQAPHTGQGPYNEDAADIAMPIGTPITAAAPGIVRFAGSKGGNGVTVMVDHGNNMCTQYLHLSQTRSTVGQQVGQGKLIALSGNSGNSSGPHLHFAKVSCNSETTRGPLTTVEYPNGFRTGERISSQNTPGAKANNAAPLGYADKLGGINSAGTPTILEGQGGSSQGVNTDPWTIQDNAVDLSLTGNRTGLIDATGVAKAKEGSNSSTAPWVTLRPNAKKVKISPTRVGVLENNGDLWVLQGPLQAGTWAKVQSNVTDFDLTDSRVGVVTADQKSSTLDGALNGAVWTNQLDGASRIVLDGQNRIGVMQNTGTLYVKDTSISDLFYFQENAVKDFDLAGDRVAVIDATGLAKSRDGDITRMATWRAEKSDAKSVRISYDQTAVLGNDGVLYAKQGDHNTSPWTTQGSNVTSIALPKL